MLLLSYMTDIEPHTKNKIPTDLPTVKKKKKILTYLPTP